MLFELDPLATGIMCGKSVLSPKDHQLWEWTISRCSHFVGFLLGVSKLDILLVDNTAVNMVM